MTPKYFPPPEFASSEGLLEMTKDINSDILFDAYSNGIFPWPQENLPVLWFSPSERGVLDFSELHLSQSLKKTLRQNRFEVRFDSAFEQVIRLCQGSARPGQSGTWITDQLIEAYLDFHQKGFAHSVECYLDQELVGGVYGVYVKNVFCGESMFYLEPNASKVALVHLIEYLRSHHMKWMDIQMVTPLLESMGGKYISRKEFLNRLEIAQSTKTIKIF